MDASTNIAAIQVAVAPVFLIVGIAGLLNMLSLRLGRIIDRSRVIDERLSQELAQALLDCYSRESVTLQQRVRLVNRAIQLCVVSALIISLLVVVLFVGEYVNADLGGLVAGLFMLAMLVIIWALFATLAEMNLAIKQAQDMTVASAKPDKR